VLGNWQLVETMGGFTMAFTSLDDSKKKVLSPEHDYKENSSLISCLELQGFEVNPSVQSANLNPNPPDIGRPNNCLRLPWQDFPRL